MIKIKDSLSGKEKTLPKNIRLFVCGPTVYNYSHIGHARTYLAFDLLVRYLRSLNYKVKYVQNITDIDDKIINESKKLKISPFKLAKKFFKFYLSDLKKLNINSVDIYAPASKYIKEIESQISRLIKKGYAYQTKSGIYFDVQKFPDYGKLSKQNLDQLSAGYRIEPDPYKHNVLDFALWKTNSEFHNNSKKKMVIYNGEPLWQSPFGWGRPGWHIEDTAISEKFFGLNYEMHGGAVELKFPHHEAEIAQARALSGKKEFVKIWMHTGVLLINGEKMSKSLNNFIGISQFLEEHSADSLRMLVFQSHYSSPINYSQSKILESEKIIDDLKIFLAKIKIISKQSKNKPLGFNIQKYKKDFYSSLDDNFNTPKALGVMLGLIKDISPKIWFLSKEESLEIYKFIYYNFKILGFNLKTEKIPKKIVTLAKKRDFYRNIHKFSQSDALRNKIFDLGYILEDTKFGTLLWPRNKRKNYQQE